MDEGLRIAATVLWVVLAVGVVLPLVLLVLPMELAFECVRKDGIAGQVTIRLLFGWVDVRIPIRPGNGAPKPARSPEPKGNRRPARVLGMLRQAPFRQRLYRLVKDLGDAVRFHRLYLHLRLGLGDPADTGMLWAFIGPLSVMAKKVRNAEVLLEPDFMDAVFEFHAQGHLRLVPLQCILLVLGLVLSPASIRAWRTAPPRYA
jgi:hypothetical protein